MFPLLPFQWRYHVGSDHKFIQLEWFHELVFFREQHHDLYRKTWAFLKKNVHWNQSRMESYQHGLRTSQNINLPFLSHKSTINLPWLVVWTPLKNISQLGWLFPIYGKIKKCSKPPTSPMFSIKSGPHKWHRGTGPNGTSLSCGYLATANWLDISKHFNASPR